eukprot:CAMPEP_0179160060 /NCGR_PEP_ID=MMETSP0796-20121207/78209_1 /TAXON_ID=73915 /ORGANISM="Pyrodinium bahamense, Strain pbaha01" /LENGTH=889 /DNA_ID=CAMNT_0020861907 /DNA_START=21 /DNA_END=2688 /DNA_ORIENTATION=+
MALTMATGLATQGLRALRIEFLKDIWNWLDLICVLLWIAGTVATSFITVNPSVFRLVRLVRLLRMLRLMRTLQGCESLYLMTTAIKASILALMWSSALIFLIQMFFALLLNQFLHDYLLDESISHKSRLNVYRYFGTFSKAFLTMFEYMLANWPPASRALTEDVSQWTVLFILGYQCIVGFAVVKVVMGVFLNVTFNVAATDDILMVAQRERQIETHTKKMQRLFKAADQDGNGILDKGEFREMVNDPVVRQWLSAMDCDVSLFARDPDVLFSLVDDGDGKLTAEELVKGVARMQGAARSIDLAVFAEQNREVRKILEQVTEDMRELQGLVDGNGEQTMKLRPSAREFSMESLPVHCARSLDTDMSSILSEATEKNSTTRSLTSQPQDLDRSYSARLRRRGRRAVSAIMWRTKSRTSLPDGEDLKRSKWSLEGLDKNPRFEALFSALICSDMLAMAFEVQYNGFEVGYKLGYSGESSVAAEVWPWAEDTFYVSNWFFAVVFAIEVILKMLGMRCSFFRDPWNYFDAVIVIFGLLEASMLRGREALSTGIFLLDTGVLRFARLARLLRMLRLVRAIQGFDSLYLMMTSIKGSIMALLWSSALMFVVQMWIALIVNVLLESYFLDDKQTDEDRQLIYMYFGDFSRAMLTMFEITLANWIPCARALTERVSEWYVIFALSHKVFIGFAVVMVITGVFLNETFRVAATDDMIMMNQKHRQTITHTKKMKVLFEAADEDGNGILDREEFRDMMSDPSVVTWLSSMGLEMQDVDTLFTMVCKESNQESHVNLVELVKGVARLKGSAKSIDMAVVLLENKQLLRQVRKLQRMWERVGGQGAAMKIQESSSLADNEGQAWRLFGSYSWMNRFERAFPDPTAKPKYGAALSSTIQSSR